MKNIDGVNIQLTEQEIEQKQTDELANEEKQLIKEKENKCIDLSLSCENEIMKGFEFVNPIDGETYFIRTNKTDQLNFAGIARKCMRNTEHVGRLVFSTGVVPINLETVNLVEDMFEEIQMENIQKCRTLKDLVNSKETDTLNKLKAIVWSE